MVTSIVSVLLLPAQWTDQLSLSGCLEKKLNLKVLKFFCLVFTEKFLFDFRA